jgi:hypothetical protein
MRFDSTQPSHQSLRNIVAERTRPLLAWVGAGLSKPAGMPAWGELRDDLVGALRAKADSMDSTAARRSRGLAANAATNPDLWQAFQLLQEGLQPTTFRDQIRSALSPSVRVETPEAYKLLWQLPLRGVLNLNLDGLATRALVEHGPQEVASVQRSGQELARLRHVLTGQAPFVGNLHGVLDDAKTWVFTKSEIDRLLADSVYTEFLSVCLSVHTVIFIGLTVDDLAVGGILESLSKRGVQNPTHYWLTHWRDSLTDFWAERVGVELIRYNATGQDHSAVNEFLVDLAHARPLEESPAPPVALDRAEDDPELPSPEEMRTWEPDRIRRVLNAHASTLLRPDTDEAHLEYQEFLRDYRRPIYTAWYMGVEAGENDVLGYTLVREIARGAFGRVYEGTDAGGDRVAVKVLLEDVRKDPLSLHAFRRGVQSMRILSDRAVEGMVRYREASEIPALVVMDYVDGPNLATARTPGI